MSERVEIEAWLPGMKPKGMQGEKAELNKRRRNVS